jgi:hypothetical protein
MASAQKPGGILKMYSIDSPASMSILGLGIDGLQTHRWKELDSNFGCRARQAWVPT